MAVAIQDAAMNALQSWLQTKCGNDIDIDQQWPDPEKPLPAKAMTIVAGPWEDDMLQPEIDETATRTVTGHPEQRMYRWRVLERTQPFQLDLWATYAPVRSDMIKRLDDALAVGTLSNEPAANGPILTLGDGWSGTVDFLFFGGRTVDSAWATQQSEYRASYNGEARMILYVDAPSARQATIKFKQTLDNVQRADVLVSTVSD